MWIVCITSVRHVLTVNGYGGRQTKENEKSWCFKGWETLVNDYQGSKKLLLQSTKYSYYLMLFMSLPMYFLADPLLYIWLGDNVPEYTTIFLQIAIVQSLFQVFDVSFYTALYAKGQLKENALISPMLNLLAFPVVYFLF